ncbi:GFA family protein [Vibrio ulleungensis]|uniref:Aldehyde-activating protein n=1 Tax=Vibrio ulleungensis TaxID=2807619 RepID=A0ABS2HFK7_9VIBR|nr:aldehyde-activating protein [Vibrio ulleungensis]MBM7034898.1 aldehyde-activating protein [Vibrio ulleungensis]
MIQASCHCGNVQIVLPKLTDTATECNCSICFRYGARWGYFTEKDLTISVGSMGVQSYTHGDRMIAFVHCRQCGCLTHYTSVNTGPDSRVAVNYRMIDSGLHNKLRIRHFDGADSWTFLD